MKLKLKTVRHTLWTDLHLLTCSSSITKMCVSKNWNWQKRVCVCLCVLPSETSVSCGVVALDTEKPPLSRMDASSSDSSESVMAMARAVVFASTWRNNIKNTHTHTVVYYISGSLLRYGFGSVFLDSLAPHTLFTLMCWVHVCYEPHRYQFKGQTTGAVSSGHPAQYNKVWTDTQNYTVLCRCIQMFVYTSTVVLSLAAFFWNLIQMTEHDWKCFSHYENFINEL